MSHRKNKQRSKNRESEKWLVQKKEMQPKNKEDLAKIRSGSKSLT